MPRCTRCAVVTVTRRSGRLYLPTMRGVMVTDRARSYDAQALSGVRQQKCLAHVLRSVSEVVETKSGQGTQLWEATE